MAFAPLTTERLTLRAMVAADAEPLAARRSDPDTAAFQAWTIPYPPERARDLVAAVAGMDGPTRGEWFQVAIVESASGHSIGDVAVHLSDNGHIAQIGYTLNPSARGRGFATEAAAAMVDHLVTEVGVHRLEAETDPAPLPGTARARSVTTAPRANRASAPQQWLDRVRRTAAYCSRPA